MSDIIAASGTRVFISGAITSAIDTLAEFEAISAWTELGLIEGVGIFGDKSSDVTFVTLKGGRTSHYKGVRDAGSMALVCAHDPTDAGQIAFVAASDTNDDYGFRVIIPDGPTPSYSNTILYFRGIVTNREYDIGVNDHVVRRNFAVGINSAIFRDNSAIISDPGSPPDLGGALSLSAGAGSFTITGTGVTLRNGWKLAAAAGSFVLTGTDVTLTHSLKLLSAGAGAFVLNGTSVTLSGSPALSFSVDAGSFVLTGTDVALRHGYRVAAGSGSFVLTGTSVLFIPPEAAGYLIDDLGNILTDDDGNRLTAN